MEGGATWWAVAQSGQQCVSGRGGWGQLGWWVDDGCASTQRHGCIALHLVWQLGTATSLQPGPSTSAQNGPFLQCKTCIIGCCTRDPPPQLEPSPVYACMFTCCCCCRMLPYHPYSRLWLNGGPGCSSFDGWVYEQGPFKLAFSRATNGVTLHENPFAWSKVANMIFLDSPSREFRDMELEVDTVTLQWHTRQLLCCTGDCALVCSA